MKMFKRNPGFKHLRIFGEMGFVLIHSQIGFKSKISDKGRETFFAAYATEHAGDVYRIYDPKTRRIRISRDVRWMRKFYNSGHPMEIPNYNENNQETQNRLHPLLDKMT